jgi:hypothetical protein
MNLKIQQKSELFKKWKRIITIGFVVIAIFVVLIFGMWDAYRQGYREGYITCKEEMWNVRQVNFSDVRILDRYKGDVLWNISK